MLNDRIETLIINNLIHNEQYTRSVLPYIQREYFKDETDSYLVSSIKEYVEKYNNLPTTEALLIKASNETISQDLYDNIQNFLSNLSFDSRSNPDENWLLENTEKFCQEKAQYNAIIQCAKIIQGEDDKFDRGAVPKILSDALAITFDPNVGHDYIDDAEERYDFYHATEERIPCDLKYLNKITSGGIPKKTLNIFLAGTGVGKSLAMCHLASSYLSNGYNVLYITLELSEKRVAERIDANLMNVTLDNLKKLPKPMFYKKMEKLRSRIVGKLKIKEYPTATANTNHFRALLNELKMKMSFAPDVVFIDYLNLCTSSRLKGGSNVNSYTYVKAIAEELRGMAVENDIPIWSATQTTRSGFSSSDLGLEDTSESFGLPATADLMLGLSSSEELDKLGRIMVKQLKNRDHDINVYKRFLVGIDRSKMRLYDLEDSEQETIQDTGIGKDSVKVDKPVFDSTPFGEGLKAEKKIKFNFDMS